MSITVLLLVSNKSMYNLNSNYTNIICVFLKIKMLMCFVLTIVWIFLSKDVTCTLGGGGGGVGLHINGHHVFAV